MKRKILNYYEIMVIILFMINNVLLANLKGSGILCNVLMILAIIANIIIIKKYDQEIKYKNIALIFSVILFILSKNQYQIIFIISNILLLITTAISESKSIVFITNLMWCYVIICPIIFILTLIIALSYEMSGSSWDVYEDTHYYCEKNYEIYAYSAGAMDSYHYSVGKYYIFLDFDDIINISYHERKETTLEEYEKILNNKCVLVGDENGFN